MDDPFIREHIEDLLRNIRTQVLIKLITPYTRIHIPFISKELNIDSSEVENLLVSCILDSIIQGRIDQVNHGSRIGQQGPRCRPVQCAGQVDGSTWDIASDHREQDHGVAYGWPRPLPLKLRKSLSAATTLST
ncbi:hypothetical protein HPB49_016877 [Dermacentor silvarum]|uniref:Uncharacterized protein n=1 Tax=Dermacentor silvarum TaxID=543639 RepID=A0ACB8E1W6_DERSI|nr:hypothetical protein HPB49_016877 [Dermacentor silvarum]